MTIISSQHYIDDIIVDRKIAELQSAGTDRVVIPCYYVGMIDGEEYAMQSDGHHTLAAAREIGLPVEFDIIDDPESLTGEDLLSARYMDGDWYDVERSNPYYSKISLIW